MDQNHATQELRDCVDDLRNYGYEAWPDTLESVAEWIAAQGRRHDEAQAEIDGLSVKLETHILALNAVAWYFDQRRYKVSPVGDGTYYVHDKEGGRYATLIHSPTGESWPSIFMALTAARHDAEKREAIDAAREGK